MWNWFSGHVSFKLPGNFCMRMAAVSAKQSGMGNWTGRADNTQENTNQEDLLIQEYYIPTKMSNLFHPRCRKWPRAFPCKYIKLLSNLLKASSSTALCPRCRQPSPQPKLPLWLLEPQLPPWLPHFCSPAAAASCCRAAPGRAARCMLSSTKSWSFSWTWTRDLPRDAVFTSWPSSSWQPYKTLRSSLIAGKKRKILKW